MNRRVPERELRAVSDPAEDMPIGMQLVELGHLREGDIPAIEKAQRKTGLRFGEMAVKLGFVKRGHVEQALSRQFNFPFLPHTALSPELSIATTPKQPVAEAIRTLRTQLALSWMNKLQTQCLSVVSAERGEGRSFIAANLAVAFAQMNERALIIDMDLRYPRQHHLFRISNRYGLTSLLGGRGTGREIQRVDGYETLCVLPAGPLPPSPQELLAAKYLSPVLEHLRTQFDVIIVDTPAWSCGADAQIISAQAGQALLVSTPRKATRAATDSLVKAMQQVGVSIVGAAVNRR